MSILDNEKPHSDNSENSMSTLEEFDNAQNTEAISKAQTVSECSVSVQEGEGAGIGEGACMSADGGCSTACGAGM